MEQKPRIFTLQFVLLSLSSFLFFGSFNMIIPELPGYLTRLGGEEYKGLIISLFAFAALLSRPFSGKITDTVGRIPVMIFGSLVCVVVGIAYPFLGTVSGFLLLRFFHGFSTGFKPIGTSAILGDIVPFNRRGEAMGILGIFGSIGMAIGPVLGNWVATKFGIEFMFYASAASALLSAMLVIRMKETLPEPQRFTLNTLKVKRGEIIEPRVIMPGIVMLLSVYSFGVILTVIPDYSDFIGMKNRGGFFAYFTISSLFIRFIAGKASDIWGRVVVLKIGIISMATAMFLVGLAETPFALIIAAIVFGIAFAINSPTILAWAIDLSDEKHRGRGMSTIFMALEIGIMAGALMSGWIYSNNPAMFSYTFWSGTVLAMAAFFYLHFADRKQKKAISSEAS